MNILLCSHVFEPSVGGIETISHLLASGFAAAGHKVCVATRTPGSAVERSGYAVLRRPTLAELYRLGCQADIIFQNNISLQMLLPLFLVRKPIVITHQTWLRRIDGRKGWQDFLKLFVLRYSTNIAISGAISASLPVRSRVVGNPFDREEFSRHVQMPKVKDIVFVGRLVSDKGCDLLLRAVSHLAIDGIYPSVTIIGDGPEMQNLAALAEEMGLRDQVVFMGSLGAGRGENVAQHKILAVPSLWAEPFGIVALEGIAAGCVVVASANGGLAEAVGPCGLLFPNGDLGALTAALRELLGSENLRSELTRSRELHLRAFQPELVALEYLRLFEQLCTPGLAGS